MPKLNIKAYNTVITCDWLGDNVSVLLGVVENENEHEDWWEYATGADEKIYYYLTEEEMQALKVGDVLNDGEDFTIVEIDKENPYIFNVEYEKEEKQNA